MKSFVKIASFAGIVALATTAHAQQQPLPAAAAETAAPAHAPPQPSSAAPPPAPAPAPVVAPPPAPVAEPAPVVAPAPAPAPAVAPAPVPLKPAPSAPPPKRRVTTPVVVAGGISFVALATGVVFGIMAASDASSYKAQPNNDVALAGEKKAFIADIGFGVAALFGFTAIALFMLPDEPDPGASAQTARPRNTWLTSALKGEVLSF